MNDDLLRESLFAAVLERSPRNIAILLKKSGFREEEKSASNLLAIADHLGTKGLTALIRGVLSTPDPDLALNSLERLCSTASPEELVDILGGPRGADLLTVLGTSPFLTSILVTQIHLLSALFGSERGAAFKSEAEMARELDERLPSEASFEHLQKALRLYKKQEVLRIARRDLCGLADLPVLTAEIAALAGASLHKAWQVCDRLLRRQYGPPRPEGDINGPDVEFVILGMGKLGGGELNFSSDIDLMYFYATRDGTTTGCADEAGRMMGGIPLQTYFIKLGNLITKAISQPTADGFVFRVDLDLRPEGKSGDTAQSREYAETYYESWGQSWERCALIKARPVAGSRPLGELLLNNLTPFVFRRYLDFSMIEDLKLMKQRIDGNLLRKREGESNIKLGRGGIREIEFFIQALQLIHAGKHPELRVRNSLQALDLLEQGKFISPRDHETLKEAYLFLRTVENHIQIFQEQQSHSLPARPETFRTLARSCGFADAESFRARLEEHRKGVETIYHSLFFGSEEEQNQNVGDEALALLDRATDKDAALDLLTQKGFSAPEAAYKSLLMLRDAPPHVWMTTKARRLLARIAPLFLQEILDSRDPETALRNSEEFFAALRSQTAVFALLAENPQLVHLLVSLFSTSSLLSRFFIEDPAALDALAASAFVSFSKERGALLQELQGMLGNCANYEEKLDALRRFRHEEFLRIALHDIQEQASQQEVSNQLSDLADVCLDQAAAIARQELAPRYGLPLYRTSSGEEQETAFAVVGLGQLGGRELSYHSELELIFIYEREGETAPDPQQGSGRFRCLSNQEYFSRLAQRILSILTLRTNLGVVFRIDNRQRPSGHQGPMVSSLVSFSGYHQAGAQTWQRLALAKARPLSGPDLFRKTIEEEIRRIVYQQPLPENLAADLCALRSRLEPEPRNGPNAGFGPKAGRGSLLDVEYLVHYLQIRHGKNRPGLHLTNSLELLTALAEEKLLSRDDHDKLLAASRFLLRLENRLRLLQNRSMEVLSSDPDYLARLALRLGYSEATASPGEALLKDYLQATGIIREICDRLLPPDA